MGVAISGINGTVTSNGVDMQVEGWDGDVESPEVDTTVTADAGWEDCIEGPIKISGSFDFNWNPAKGAFANLVGLMPGGTILGGTYPTLKLNLDATGNDYFQGTAKVTKLSVKSKTKDAIRMTASFRSKGAWTKPAV